MKKTWKFVAFMALVALGSVSCSVLNAGLNSGGQHHDSSGSTAPKVEAPADSKDVVADETALEVEATDNTEEGVATPEQSK